MFPMIINYTKDSLQIIDLRNKHGYLDLQEGTIAISVLDIFQSVYCKQKEIIR